MQPFVQRNGFFAHPENVVVALVADDSLELRQLGIRLILEARSSSPAKKPRKGKKLIREFRVPDINFQADCLSKIVKLDGVDPPLFKSFWKTMKLKT